MRRRSYPVKVIHHHRVKSGYRFLKVSELVWVQGEPKAILSWINLGGLPTPLHVCELDPGRLKRLAGTRSTYVYKGDTEDPRYAAAEPLNVAAGAASKGAWQSASAARQKPLKGSPPPARPAA